MRLLFCFKRLFIKYYFDRYFSVYGIALDFAHGIYMATGETLFILAVFRPLSWSMVVKVLPSAPRPSRHTRHR